MNILIAQWESKLSGSPESARLLIAALINKNWNVHVVLGHNGLYARIYKEMGCEVSIIPQKHWLMSKNIFWHIKNIPSRLLAIYRYYKLLKLYNFSLMYINTIVGPEAALVAKWLNIPVIWHIRDMYKDTGGDMEILPFGGKSVVKYFIKSHSDRIITVSTAVAKNLFENEVSAATVIMNGIANKFHPIKTKTDNKEIIIGVPGTLRPIKGHIFFLESILKIADKLPPFEIRITGTGTKPYKDRLLNLTSLPQLKNQVKFLGDIDKMNNFLNNCDIIVIPSSCDPLPRTVMESMAAGRPLIATRVGGIPEMIDHEINGLLVEYGNKQDLGDKVLKLSYNVAFRNKLGRIAAIKAHHQFTIERYQKKLLDCIESVITSSSS